MTTETRLSPDEIARDLGLVVVQRNGHRATAYTDLLDPAVSAYWINRPVPTQRKATE